MIEKYYPSMIVDKIENIDLELFVAKNINTLILDIDNTLVPNHVEEPGDNIISWVQKAKSKGFKVCIVSNGAKKRVLKFNKKLDIYAIHRAYKPNKRGFFRAIEVMGSKANETAVIGDQIFTDVYGGNKSGMFTVLVAPLDKREGLPVRFKRIFEKFVLKRYKKNFN